MQLPTGIPYDPRGTSVSPSGRPSPTPASPSGGWEPGRPLPPWAGGTMQSGTVMHNTETGETTTEPGPTIPIRVEQITRDEFMGGGQPQPTSLESPQGGIDYGQSLENIMGQYQQQPPGFMPGAGRPIGPSHQGMQPDGVPPPPPTPTLQGLRQQAPTPRTSRFDQTSRPMNF